MTYLAFDMDGTIYDCSEIVAPAFRRGIEIFKEKMGKNIEVPAKKELIEQLGVPTDQIFINLFPGLSQKEYQLLNDLCQKTLVEDVKEKKGYIYPHVVEVVDQLHDKGYKMVIASNGKLPYLKAILETYGLDKKFDEEIIVLNDTIISKNDIVKSYKSKITNKDSLIMIGDRTSDREAAFTNSVPFVGCAFGHASDEIENAKWLIHSIKELPAVVDDIEYKIRINNSK